MQTSVQHTRTAYLPITHSFVDSRLQADSFCLVGCIVAPGFEFEDFELADARLAAAAEARGDNDVAKLVLRLVR